MSKRILEQCKDGEDVEERVKLSFFIKVLAICNSAGLPWVLQVFTEFLIEGICYGLKIVNDI